jgi:catechol 2,3-dioxygenase-like lactoylglutathione lyase family enzyme
MKTDYIEGIDKIVLSTSNLQESCKFLVDFGLAQNDSIFNSLNNSSIELIESRENKISSISWGIKGNLDFLKQKIQSYNNFYEGKNCIGCKDPNGIELIFQLSQKKELSIKGIETNGWNSIRRVDSDVPIYEKSYPIEIGHIVISTPYFQETENFYKNLGFVISDRLINRGVFLRCQENSGHHDLFLIQSKNISVHHIAFTTRDIYELFAGGIYMDSQGWTTEIGPGRHPISSAFFWYFKSPLGFMIEYSCNEDFLTEKWVPRSLEYSQGITTEWAIEGGIDSRTKRQKK